MCQTASILRNQVRERRRKQVTERSQATLPPKWLRRAREHLKHVGVPRKTQQLSRNRHGGAQFNTTWVPRTGGDHTCAVEMLGTC